MDIAKGFIAFVAYDIPADRHYFSTSIADGWT
jgi:hypothetical protein